MSSLLLHAFGLLAIIILGFFLKRVGILTKADGNTLSIVIVNVTLPAVIIVNFASMIITGGLLLFIVIALFWTIIQLFLVKIFSKKESALQQQFFLYCASGFNIGNFALPFIQSFLPAAIPFISMFDLGNSLMLAGGTKVVTNQIVKKDSSINISKIIRQLFLSPAFSCYILMLILRSFSIDLPNVVTTILQPVADANIFLSMFMIGLYLDLYLPAKDRRDVLKLFSLRYGIGLVFVLLFAQLPIPSLQKVVLCLMAVTPVPLFGVIHSVDAGVKAETVGFSSSISFLISLPLMTIVLLVLGIPI